MKRKDLNYLWNKVIDEVLIDNADRRANLLLLLEGSRIEEINETTNTVVISIDNDFSRAIVESEFSSEIRQVVTSVFNSNFKILFVFKDAWDKRENASVTEEINLSVRESSTLKSEFSLDNFIAPVKGENRMVKQAALSVAIKPGEWNPFFLYGGSGLGKTHLLHAIGNKILEKDHGKSIKYLESKDFKDLVYQGTINTENINKITNDLLSYDILLIDDIQMIQSMTKAKEVFFSVFSNFINEKKQIVITSDQYPEEMKDFEERFITRFKGGVLMSVVPPDLETAKEILLQKIEKRNHDELKLTNEALNFVATNFGSNVRELEGALNKIIFWSITNEIKEEYDLQDMLEAFDGMINNSRGLTIQKIVNVVAKHYHIPSAEILGKSRKAEVVLPRQVAIYFSKTILNVSLIDIGRHFGRDHSTIISSVKKIEKDTKTNQELSKVIYDLRKKITAQ